MEANVHEIYNNIPLQPFVKVLRKVDIEGVHQAHEKGKGDVLCRRSNKKLKKIVHNIIVYVTIIIHNL